MKALFVSALLLVGFLSEATAQVVVGPIAVTNKVNGIPITVSTTSWITVNSIDNETTVDVRILADLIDLQRKFPNVVDTLGLSTDKCAARTTDARGGADAKSAAVSLKSGSLWPVDDRLIMSIRGQVDTWSCVAGSSKSGIEWKKKKFAFLDIKVPVVHKWRVVTKKNDVTQSFRGNLPIQLVKKDGTNVGLKIAEHDIKLDGQDATVTGASLSIAKMDLNRKAYNALQSAIDPAKLKAILPKEFQKMNMTVVSTRFRSYGGHAIAEINLAAASAPNTQ
ncbi:MAG: hypothetical protein WBX05_24350 [Pseudolabrys sp.]